MEELVVDPLFSQFIAKEHRRGGAAAGAGRGHPQLQRDAGPGAGQGLDRVHGGRAGPPARHGGYQAAGTEQMQLVISQQILSFSC